MLEIHEKKIKELELIANQLRQDVISALVEAGSGHSAGPLGMADIFTALYFHILRHDPKRPDWPNRDRLVLSNGHICPIQYAALARAGYFPVEELKTLRKINTRLQGHPHRTALPGVETTSGPLGSGLSQAIGMALAAKLGGNGLTSLTTSGLTSLPRGKIRIYCLMSDGEHQEGNTWEAVMFAGKHKMNNITAILDRNNIQIDGHTEDIMPLEPLHAKYEAFNWHVVEIDGHDLHQIIGAVAEAHAIYEKPTMIIAHTIPGKGVSFMEHDYLWHGNPPGKGPENVVPKEKQGSAALKELKEERQRIFESHY